MKTTDKSRGMRAFKVIAISWMLMFLVGFGLVDPEYLFANDPGVVAIDPGHGGKDKGASGTTGQLEKNVVLELARQLALVLESDYQVTLTRSGDYFVEPHQRAAIANHAGADLMISLHTGASFRHTTQGQAVYYHTGSGGDATPDSGNPDTAAQQSWRLTQLRHAQASHSLAEIMKQQLDTIPTHLPSQIKGAPLVVLQGADLPAILIELGHITNPNTEKALTTPQHMAQLVKAIAGGIHLFMDQHAQPGSP